MKTCACGCGCSRRGFLGGVGAAVGSAVLASPAEAFSLWGGRDRAPLVPPARARPGATVRVAFLYPPSTTFRDNPEGWWSWPGNDFDAEGREKQFRAALDAMAKKAGFALQYGGKPVGTEADAQQLAEEIGSRKPDGLLLVMFYNNSLPHADLALKAAEQAGIPAVFYIGLGAKHGPVTAYRRPGVYLIQSLDNFDAIERSLRAIHAKKIMSQSRLLSITDAKGPGESVEPFFGTTVAVVPFARYADEFGKVALGPDARRFIAGLTGRARERRGVTAEALENAARAHFALVKLLVDEKADGVAMNCLRRGMLKPCMSFATLNGGLVPAACENDLPAAYTQLLGQLLLGRPGFQHNPCYETERNHYYASHCTCATRLRGPGGGERPYLLRRFGHTNEGSCAIQVFWEEGEPVTMVRYYPGKDPALDVYAGRVVKSHPMPPAGGCTTNVEIALTDRDDAGQVKGHHNLLFCGDEARTFRIFAQLHRMRLAETGYRGPWPL